MRQQQRLVLVASDLVDERAVDCANGRLARLAGEQRHLPDHRAASHDRRSQVGHVVPAGGRLRPRRRRPRTGTFPPCPGSRSARSARAGADGPSRPGPGARPARASRRSGPLRAAPPRRRARARSRRAPRSRRGSPRSRRCRWSTATCSGSFICASRRLTRRGMHSRPDESMSPSCCAHAATWFIDARYWLQADANRPSWSAKSAVTADGRRTTGASRPRRCQSTKSARGPRQIAELGERVRRLPQHRPLRVPEHPLPRLLRAVRVRSGERDRRLQVLVVCVEEGEGRPLLVQEVEVRDRAGARHAAVRERDLAERSRRRATPPGRCARGSARSARPRRRRAPPGRAGRRGRRAAPRRFPRHVSSSR